MLFLHISSLHASSEGLSLYGAAMDKSIYTEQYSIFLKLLRETRENAGITQGELAVQLKDIQSFISRCENGQRRIDIVELKLWCDAIGVSLSEFSRHFEWKCAAHAELTKKQR